METGIELMAQERADQIEKHGRTVEYDKENNRSGQLVRAVTVLTLTDLPPKAIIFHKPKNWDPEIWVKMCEKSYKERLIIAGALIAAEIDRLQN